MASGDDTVAIKSGIDFFGRRYNRPSRDILFRNITTGGGYGISIGSEVSGGIINVTFEDMVINHQTAGIHIKAPLGRGGIIQNITYRNIELRQVRAIAPIHRPHLSPDRTYPPTAPIPAGAAVHPDRHWRRPRHEH